MDIISIMSEHTCGAACWLAQESVCKCSCGGKNHGIALRGENPKKLIKIDGFRYELFEVGLYSELMRKAYDLLEQTITKTITVGEHSYNYHPKYSDKGSPYRLKSVSKAQKEWPEVKNCGIAYPYALWKRVD